MTQRVVSVWLSHWRTDRLERQKKYQGSHKPRVLFQSGQGGDRIIALNQLAEQRGLRVGLLLTDAKAILPTLQAVQANPAEDAEELERLARWCIRFSPWVSLDLPDGLFLDVTGVTHLFGGEKAFLKTLRSVFTRLKFNARIAIADTAGAAWGFAHYSHKPLVCIPSGRQKEIAAGLPVQALRIASDQAEQLEQLGLQSIGQLYNIAPKFFLPRFGEKLSQRLEQFLHPGRESLSPLIHEPEYYASLSLPEPVGNVDDIRVSATRLLERVTERLAFHGKGASCFTLSLYGIKGDCHSVAVKTCEPVKDKSHVTHLFRERLSVLENRLDPTFDIDALSLHAEEISVIENRQAALSNDQETHANTSLLLDKLTARLGRDAVKQYSFRESHIPERAVIAVTPYDKSAKNISVTNNRPVLLLPKPELIQAIAETPDYPPRQFEWRYRTYRIVKAEGPERISNEWWRNQEKKITRDYFRVEDRTGARFWVFREGVYQRETDRPKWFMHGVFP